MQQPKLYSNLTFQKHGWIQLSLLSVLPPYANHHVLPLSALFHLFSFISSYSCHISPAPNLCLSITLLLYFSQLLSLVMYLFLMVTLPHSFSLHIRFGWVKSTVNCSYLTSSRSQSSFPLPKQTLKGTAAGEYFIFQWQIHSEQLLSPPPLSANCWLRSWLIQFSGKTNKAWQIQIIVCRRDKVIMRKCNGGNWSFFRKLSDLLGMPIITSCVSCL